MKSKRMLAFFIDDIIAAMIMNIPFFVLVIFPLIKGDKIDNIILRSIISTLIAFLYFLLRDLPENGSIGKRLLKLKVIDADTKEAATKAQRIIRNIPLILGWIEVIVFLASQKRIGDRMAKTDVVEI